MDSQQFGKLVGISPMRVRQMSTGREVALKLHELIFIANALDTTLFELLTPDPSKVLVEWQTVKLTNESITALLSAASQQMKRLAEERKGVPPEEKGAYSKRLTALNNAVLELKGRGDPITETDE